MEQMKQDKEAWMIKAVRNCVSLFGQVMTLLITVFHLIQISDVQSQIEVLSPDLISVFPEPSVTQGCRPLTLEIICASN